MHTQLDTRRDFLRYGFTGTTALMIGCSTTERAFLRSDRLPAPHGDATFVGKIPFTSRGNPRLEEVYGVGLTGRFRQDLSLLTPETLITSNERFYIRTRCPTPLDLSKPWAIRVGGASGELEHRPVESLTRASRSMGVHLLECSGNGRPFGLLSAAEWSGVPLAEYLELEGGAEPRTEHLFISGFDEHPETDDPRQLGASWIYRWQDLVDAGAFLATGMNGVPLPPDHGYPVRLIVPGWYGCTCIKWVDEIRFVGPDELSTAHMREFAGRTEQSKAHERAADYAAGLIDLTAVPVRVEHWELAGEPIYRFVGVLWGGRQLTKDLRIELGEDVEAVPVDYFNHQDYRTWSLWSHIWRPTTAGMHRIRMRIGESEIQTRRLDRGFYSQRVEIPAV